MTRCETCNGTMQPEINLDKKGYQYQLICTMCRRPRNKEIPTFDPKEIDRDRRATTRLKTSLKTRYATQADYTP